MFPVQYIMELTFTQAAKGVNKEIVVNIQDSCVRCDGKGHEPGTKAQRCHYCNGTGMVSAEPPVLLCCPFWGRVTSFHGEKFSPLISLSRVKLG